MNVEEYRNYCISKKGVTESFPFDNSTLVFKVMGKMFTLGGIEPFTGFSAKCNPPRAIKLRESYPHGIVPAYHMNKTHWNGIKTNEGVPDSLMFELIDHSYELVVKGLPKKIQEELLQMD